MPCGTCAKRSIPQPEPAPLCQIRHGYRARWNSLDFSVEAEASQWTLRVEDSGQHQTLYIAHRRAAREAQVAAADFAIFNVLGPASRLSPGKLAGELKWQEYW